MSMVLLVLMFVFSLVIALVATANNATVTLNYLLGDAQLSLMALILGSAGAGALAMGFLGLARGFPARMRFREAQRAQADLQHRLEFVEKERYRSEEDGWLLRHEGGSRSEHIAAEGLSASSVSGLSEDR